MNLRDLKLRLRSLLSPRRIERELDEELRFHLQRETEKYVADGLSPADARARAHARFGSVSLVADRCRDARGTTFIDSTIRDILYAFRSFARTPLAAVTVVGTVAVGLALVALVFTFFNAFFYREDAVRDPDELFAVLQAPPGAESWMAFTRHDYEALRRETAVFTDVVATLRGVSTRVGGRTANATLVTGNFFEVIGAAPAHGRMLTPADDQPSASLVIVLSYRGAARLFPGVRTAIGRTVLVNGARAEVVGVMPADFRGLRLGAPDYWAPLALASRIRPSYAGRENQLALEVIGRLKPGISTQAAAAGLSVWGTARADARIDGDKPAYFRLRPSRGTVGDDAAEALMVFAPLFFAFGLILLAGCANVANLLLARGMARQREIGIRLSLGASRKRVVRQLLTESLLLAITAAAVAYALSRLLLGAAVYGLLSTMPPEIAETMTLEVPPADWRIALFLLVGALVATVFFGVAPALQATRIELVRAMRGELVRDARPGRARNTLVGLQVTASVVLLICAAVFLRGAFNSAVTDPGVRTSDTVVVDVDNEPLRAALLQAIAGDPAVVATAASAPHGLAIPPGALAEATSTGVRSPVVYRLASSTYFDLLDIDLLNGRGFTVAERDPQAGVAVVSESTAHRLWPGRNPVGESLRLTEPVPGRTFTVVGVARDTRSVLRGPHPSDAVVYVPSSTDTAGTALTLRVKGDPEKARLELTERLTRVDPGLGDITTMRTMAGLEAYLLRLAFWVTIGLGALALALTLSGLFSVLSYLVEQRKREIGVRMALGATARDLSALVLVQFLFPVGVGMAAGAALAVSVASLLLASPMASLMSSVDVFDPAAYAGSLVATAVACASAAFLPALRASRIDPIATLRQD